MPLPGLVRIALTILLIVPDSREIPINQPQIAPREPVTVIERQLTVPHRRVPGVRLTAPVPPVRLTGTVLEADPAVVSAVAGVVVGCGAAAAGARVFRFSALQVIFLF